MVKLGLKSRSRRVVQDSSVAAEKSKIGNGDGVEEEGDQCLWERLPPELLREVLRRVEESESNWPSRKHVVACAGVCRSWRNVMQEMVKVLEVSGKITFPISVKQPGSKESLLHCFIKRNRSSRSYYLYMSLSQALADDGKFLLAAQRIRRTTCFDYMISLRANNASKSSPTYIGKLRCNLLGRKFVVYDALPHCGAKMSKTQSTGTVGSKHVPSMVPVGNYPVAHVSYDLNVLGPRGPRRMQCVLDAIPTSAIKPGGVAPTQMHFPLTGSDAHSTIPFFRSKSNYHNKSSFKPLRDQVDRPLILENKAPQWHEQLQCWCLNFNGRVTVASVKNFQLVATPENESSARPEHDRVILQFGKVGKDVFTMDYGYPISAFQAFAICLSSFDTKIACE